MDDRLHQLLKMICGRLGDSKQIKASFTAHELGKLVL